MPTWKKTMLFALGAVACFHVANAGVGLGVLMVGFFYGLLRMVEGDSFSELFWGGLGAGLLIYAPPLLFFWRIFGAAAISLWMILGAWLVTFLLLAWWWRRRYGRISLVMVAPVLWTGLEYFRGELYYLRFSWLSPGYAFSGSAQFSQLAVLGVYGIGFACMAAAGVLFLLPGKFRVIAGSLLVAALTAPWPQAVVKPTASVVHLAGMQLEFPSLTTTLKSLRVLVRLNPQADVLVLSEYTLDGPVPAEIKAFCRDEKKFLIVGAKAPAPGGKFYDTAFVVGPKGDIVFSQAKCVPVQFFQDGLPATEQRVWYSPWGKIGLGICYDASYRRVVDELVEQGAQALIFPTMDVISWGAQEHKLNALIGPARAAEYQLPFFRLASSGISEAVNPDGSTQSRVEFPGQGQIMTADFSLPAQGRLPLDHWLAPACTAIVAGLIWWLIFTGATKRFRRKKEIAQPK